MLARAAAVTATAADRWRSDLADWAIPDHIMQAAPEPPWSFSPALFSSRTVDALAEREGSRSHCRAAEALPDCGSVLDVGAGGGAGSLPLVPPAALIVAVDQGAEMLASFAATAERLGVAHREVQGSWPEIAAKVDVADVVVCHNVLYNVADLVPFAAALTVHARHRVVVEITAEHPTSSQRPLWRALHGIERPISPTANDALAVLEEMDLEIDHEQFERSGQPWSQDMAAMVAMTRRRLCVGADRDPEIETLLREAAASPPRPAVTIWWPGQG